MRKLIILMFSCICTFAVAQSSSSIVLDASSLIPVNTDEITGLNMDPIGLDRSNRPCARIKLHINRMTPEEIREVEVRTIGGNVIVMKQQLAQEGSGLIVELTANPATRFYLHHDRLGDSNPVSLALEGNREYKMEAWNETRLSIVVSYSVPGADVYLDEEYIGVISYDNHLSIRDITMGSHQLRVKTGTSDILRQITVSPDQVFFNVDARGNSNLQGFVIFKVDRNDAEVWLDGEQLPVNNGMAQKLVKYGNYSYSIYSQNCYTVQGEVGVDSGQIVQNVVMEQIADTDVAYQERGRIRISASESDGAEVYVDSVYVGTAPLTTHFLSRGMHTVRVHKQNYFDYESKIVLDQGSIFMLSPVLKPDFMTVRLTADEEAEIWINGEMKGTGVWKGELVNGDYVVESRKKGYITGTDNITVRENMPSTDIRLSRLQVVSGFLSVTSDPAGSSILIDGKMRGVTPLFINDIAVGEHSVSIFKEGYEQWSETVTISEGNEASVAASLRRMLGVETKDVTDITEESARCGGVIVEDGVSEVISKGVVWSLWPDPVVDLTTKVETEIGNTEFSCKIDNLLPTTKYYIRAYVISSEGTSYGAQKEFVTAGEKKIIQGTDLAETGTSNCYIINSAGIYSFPPVKGNSSESAGNVKSVKVLWESSGTDEKVSQGDLLNSVRYDSGRIIIRTHDILREGNAVVAAVDDKGDILWSWHIWITDYPQEQIYANGGCVLMDRNLGAISTSPGYVGSLGLLYQWGRKDPFIGSRNIQKSLKGQSSKSWFASWVSSGSSTGTIEYSIANPMTFITSPLNVEDPIYSDPIYSRTDDINREDFNREDWLFSESNDSLWTNIKTIYDPCPEGWRVPDGGKDGVWGAIMLSNTGYDSYNKGLSYTVNPNTISWYPASGYRRINDGDLIKTGVCGMYWTTSTLDNRSGYLIFDVNGKIYPTVYGGRASGFSVRCQKESE